MHTFTALKKNECIVDINGVITYHKENMFAIEFTSESLLINSTPTIGKINCIIIIYMQIYMGPPSVLQFQFLSMSMDKMASLHEGMFCF